MNGLIKVATLLSCCLKFLSRDDDEVIILKHVYACTGILFIRIHLLKDIYIVPLYARCTEMLTFGKKKRKEEKGIRFKD